MYLQISLFECPSWLFFKLRSMVGQYIGSFAEPIAGNNECKYWKDASCFHTIGMKVIYHAHTTHATGGITRVRLLTYLILSPHYAQFIVSLQPL